ncbi:MAG: RHS repeat-associated core domain-containing protein [Victivallales bacterium]
MYKMFLSMVAFLLGFSLLAGYDPNTGRFLSRDPIGEKGGTNLYVANKNDNINRIDALGLWSSVCGGDHKTFAIQSFYWVLPADNYAKKDEKVIKNILDVLVSENVNVDSQFFSNDEYHFTRPINEFNVSGKEKEKQNLIQEYRRRYSANLKDYIRKFEKGIAGDPKYNDCKEALKDLGKVTHPWQDYYAHAVINYDASYYSLNNNPSNFSFITGNKIGQVTGNPDSPGADMKPASFHIPTLFNTPIWFPDPNGEHYMGEPGDSAPDSSSRRRQTVDFVAGKYQKHLIEEWWPKCFCKFKEELSK